MPDTAASTTASTADSTAASTTRITTRRHRSRRSRTTINDLPEPLILHILSFLYIAESIQTSLVSRKFRNLWHSIPSLHFDILEFYSRSTSPNPRSSNSRQVFAEFISRTLLFRPPNPLTKFHLTFEYTNFHQHKPYIHVWIQKAINLSVSELILDFNEYGFSSWVDESDDEDEEGHRICTFEFHLLDIAKSCIKVLELHSCYLIFPPITCKMDFVSLKSLELEGVEVFSMHDDLVCNLLERCVNLEILKLKNMEFESPGGLKICSDTIKELYLESCCVGGPSYLDYEICCPSLRKISLVCLDVGKYVIKDTTLLEEAFVDFLFFVEPEDYDKSWERMLDYFCNISSLTVWDELLESNEVPPGCERVAPNLKHLEIFCSYNDNDLVGLSALLKIFPKLETLVLCTRGANDENLHQDYMQASTVFNIPCLRKVILRNYWKSKCQRHFIKLFKKSGIVLEKIVLLHENESIRKGLQRRILFNRRPRPLHFIQTW